MKVLLLGDSTPDALAETIEALEVRGHQVTRESTAIAREVPLARSLAMADLIIVDAAVAEASGLVERLVSDAPGVEVIVIGASSGKRRPEVLAELAALRPIEKLLEVVDDLADVLDGERLREPIDLVNYETVFAGDSPQILTLLRRVRLVARSQAPVWIFGDDGSSRAIISRAIHERSARRGQPFLAFNVTGHSDDELAPLLFEGDAAAVAQTAAGTLYLEHLDAAGPKTQRELVQFLGRKPAVGPRLIVGVQRVSAATGPQNLLSPDLYYRLKVLEVEIPPLKERARDLEQIVGRMLERLASDGRIPVVSATTMRLLGGYSFPGNLLELAHALTHAFVLSRGSSIEPQHLPASIRAAAIEQSDIVSLDAAAKRFERDYLLRVLRSVGGHRGQAAEVLGLSRKGLWGKLKAHGISDDDIDSD